MSERQSCPNCGSELPVDAPQGLCPACLLRQGMDSEAPAPPSRGGSPATGPPPEETVPVPGAGMAASRTTRPTRSPLDSMATDPVRPGSGPEGDEGSLEPGTVVGYFGDYKLIKELGRGGMGVVYKALQISLNRPVALKLLRADVLATDDERRRFQNEAEAVAALDHPHIVPILEVAEHDGRRYFTMKLIGGPNLGEKLAIYAGDPKSAARLLATAAEAVHHAHQRGILHRDLKPANILVDDHGEPHVGDFGLAKRIEGDSELTISGAILGTPAYMSPEQASGRRGAVTTASDVHGLGAVLYALLTGRAPFGGDDVMEILQKVREMAPAPPSRLNPLLPRDLEIVCLKCLEKDPRRRYATAAELAADLRRWLADEPIAARPVSRLERAWRWCRRKPAVAGLGAGVATLILVVGVAGPIAALREAVLRREAERTGYEARIEAIAATQSLVGSHRSQAKELHHANQAGRQQRALELLKHAGELQTRTDDLVKQLGGDPKGWRGKSERFWREQLPGLRTEAVRWLALASLQPVAPAQFPVDTSEPARADAPVTGLALSPDGAALAFLHATPREDRPGRTSRVEVVDTATGRVAGGFDLGPGHTATAVALAFDAAGRHLVIARAIGVENVPHYIIEHRAWPTGEISSTVRLRWPEARDPRLPLEYARLAFSPDLRHLLTVPRTGSADAPTVWSVADGRPMRVFDAAFRAQDFSASSDQVIGGSGPEIQFVAIASGAVTRRLTLPDRPQGMSRGNDPFGWEPPSDGRPRFGHERFINAEAAPRLVPSPDGNWVVAVVPGMVLMSNPPQFGIEVLIFEIASGEVRGHLPLPVSGNTYYSTGFLPLLAFGGGGRWLAALTPRQVTVASFPDGAPLHAADLPITRVALPSDPQASPRGIGGDQLPLGLVADRSGTRLVSAADDRPLLPGQNFSFGVSRPEPAVKHQIVQVWDLAVPRLRPEAWFFRGAARSVKIGSGGQIVSGGDDREVHVWRPSGPAWAVGYPGPGTLYKTHAANWDVFGRGEIVRYGRFDPSGRVFVSRLPDRVDLWDAETGLLRRSFPASNLLEEWDAKTGRVRQVHHPRNFLALSRDARALAIHDLDERGKPVIRLLDVARDAWTLTLPEGLSEGGFAPDGRHFVAQGNRDPASGRGGVLILADADLGRIVARIPFGQRSWFGPGGKRVAVYGDDGETPILRVFELATGRRVGELKGVVPDLNLSSNSLEIWFSPDGEQVALFIGQRPPDRNQEQFHFSTWTIGRTEATRIESRWTNKDGSAAFARGGTRLVLSGSKEAAGGRFTVSSALEVWDIAGGHEPLRLIAVDGLNVMPTVDRTFLLDEESGRLVTHLGFSEATAPTCVIWDVITGREVQRLSGGVNGATREGRILLVVDPQQSSVHTLVRWTTGGAARMTIDSANEPFVGPDGRTVVAQNTDAGRSVGLWDLDTGRQRLVLGGHAAVLTPHHPSGADPVVSPDGRLLVTQSTRGPSVLNLVELLTGKVVRSIPIPRPAGTGDGPVLDCSFDADGRRLAFNVNDRYRILDLESGRILALDRPGHRGSVRSVDVSRDGSLVASGSDDGTIIFWEAATGRFVATLEDGSDPIRDICFSPAGDRLAARDADGRLRVWQLDRSLQGARPAVISSLLWTDSATAMAFSSDGALLAAGRSDGTISLLDAGDGRSVRVLSAGPDTGSVRALAVQPAGSMLASGGDDGSVRLWDLSHGTLAGRWAIGPAPIRALAFGGGGLLGVSAGDLEIWDTRHGERLLNLERNARLVNTLSFSPDGRFLVSGSDDQSVALWDFGEYHDQLVKLRLGW
jgi:WD40 repeat protein